MSDRADGGREPMSFAALYERATAGDQDALGELVRHYESEICIVARVRLGSAMRGQLDTVDIVQSVHGSLMRGLRQGRFDVSSPQKLIALAQTIVRRKIARKWRSLKREENVELSDVPATPTGDLKQQLEADEMLAVACASLSETDRRLLELRLEGHTTAEAARRMGADPDLMRVRLSRIRQKLGAQGFTELGW